MKNPPTHSTSCGLRNKKKPFKRRKIRKKKGALIAYDLETTRIEAGTPELKYLTVWSENGCLVSTRVNSLDSLARVLWDELLLPENDGARFVAWNANHFDVYFIGLALLDSPAAIIRPYLTRSKAMRGLHVEKDGCKWQFLDGIAMTGITKPLKSFVATFAPHVPKLALDLDAEEFDADNPQHVAYAERDAEGLYEAISHADAIAEKLTGTGLTPTIGNLAIKYFQSQLPKDVLCWQPTKECEEAVRGSALRGGFCYANRKYKGPVWKYDLNQAYAAAMRDARLPSGRLVRTNTYNSHKPGVYCVTHAWRHEIATGGATAPPVAFYYRDVTGRSHFDGEEIRNAFLTSIEIEQLRSEGWSVEISHGWFWTDAFSATEFVDELERLRFTDPEGPSGPLGTMVKALGNNAYGKTLEQLDSVELVMAAEKPEGFHPFAEWDESMRHFWFKFGDAFPRPYHQPQIGAFITAHVRMEVRRAILLNPRAWIYADTDCVVFSEPVEGLWVDPKRYGAWKAENEGDEYVFITKKVYASASGDYIRAKGLNVRSLTLDDMLRWYEGEAPVQTQTQRNSFIRVVTGHDMFKTRTKTGQKSATT